MAEEVFDPHHPPNQVGKISVKSGKPPIRPFYRIKQRRNSQSDGESDDEDDYYERRQRLDAFHQPWMNSCLNETVLPGSPWHKVRPEKQLPQYLLSTIYI